MISLRILDIMTHSKIYYSFIYCTLHDQGFIVRGVHRYGLPENFKNTVCNASCEDCDWMNKGIVCTDGISVKIVKHVETNYNEQYGGGFTFRMLSDILDENGDQLKMENGSPFMVWLHKIKTLTKE